MVWWRAGAKSWAPCPHRMANSGSWPWKMVPWRFMSRRPTSAHFKAGVVRASTAVSCLRWAARCPAALPERGLVSGGRRPTGTLPGGAATLRCPERRAAAELRRPPGRAPQRVAGGRAALRDAGRLREALPGRKGGAGGDGRGGPGRSCQLKRARWANGRAPFTSWARWCWRCCGTAPLGCLGGTAGSE